LKRGRKTDGKLEGGEKIMKIEKKEKEKKGKWKRTKGWGQRRNE